MRHLAVTRLLSTFQGPSGVTRPRRDTWKHAGGRRRRRRRRRNRWRGCKAQIHTEPPQPRLVLPDSPQMFAAHYTRPIVFPHNRPADVRKPAHIMANYPEFSLPRSIVHMCLSLCVNVQRTIRACGPRLCTDWPRTSDVLLLVPETNSPF